MATHWIRGPARVPVAELALAHGAALDSIVGAD